jgi:hypothetical protein
VDNKKSGFCCPVLLDRTVQWTHWTAKTNFLVDGQDSKNEKVIVFMLLWTPRAVHVSSMCPAPIFLNSAEKQALDGQDNTFLYIYKKENIVYTGNKKSRCCPVQ